MGSLFGRLYSLLKNKEGNVLEDYLTEIFAEVFEDEQMIISFFNRFTGKVLKEPRMIEITTQKTFPKLGDHKTDSRPDIVISFKDGEHAFTTFFENKIDSSEGDSQLKRYADHLYSYKKSGANTYLFYITRRYEPKDESEIFVKDKTARLYQIRWHEIYNWLTHHRNNYINKIIQYMEDMQLNETRKFLPQDIYAIQQMNRLLSMMDSCLDGPVDEVMTRLFGKATGWSNRNVQLRDSYRYIKYNDLGNYTAIGLGFFLTDEEYPLISIMWEVNPKHPKREKIIAIMNEFLNENRDWEGEDLENPTKWSNISRNVYLLNFLSEDDHIGAIQKFFIDQLEKLYSIKEMYSDYDWK